ncbi:MAG TPA: ribbon-helix-helix protein, CopG family [Candidatus Cybelea sp.]|nr:ribbon-helix-helix protein, CopG family [Candidatus Cybelea sp.]
MAVATQRVVVLMSPKEKAKLEAKARRSGASVAEFVRRSVAAYAPDGREGEVEALLKTLQTSHREALAALGDAGRELKTTRAYFAARGARK